MSWDDLRYVLAVARSGTITEAAEALGVNGTTVSRRLRAVEAEAGTALFEKLKHGAVLTLAGEEMVATAEAMEQLTNELDARIHGLDTRLEGTVRVTSTDMLIGHLMPDVPTFRARYPNVVLELLSSYQMVNLTRREADVAIRIAPRAPEHLIGRKYAEVFYAIYGSDALVASVGEKASYSSFPWLAWDLKAGRATDRWLEKNAKGAKVVMRVDTLPVMLDALRAGLGVTILPCVSGTRYRSCVGWDPTSREARAAPTGTGGDVSHTRVTPARGRGVVPAERGLPSRQSSPRRCSARRRVVPGRG